MLPPASYNLARSDPMSTPIRWPLWAATMVDSLLGRSSPGRIPSYKPKHPYSPKQSPIVGYAENTSTTFALLAMFGVCCAAVLSAAWYGLKSWRPNLPFAQKRIVLWFVLTGCLHTFFEGYFVLNHSHMASRMDLLGQFWKEYALSDSRYLTKDTFVLSIEAITAMVWGPLSFWTAYLVANSDPLRHSLQQIVSVAHIYGCVLYFATATVDSCWKGVSHSRPEFQYFWIYYVGMNVVFIIIPGFLLVDSIKESQAAFGAFTKMRSLSQVSRKSSRTAQPQRFGEPRRS